MTDADLVMAAINRHPDPTARTELAEALGFRGYAAFDHSRTGTFLVPTMRVGALDQEKTDGNR